jgi:hypothetical protein
LLLGGKLGFYCRYPYSHTRENTANSIPYALQGVDLVIYNVFSSLGLELEVRPLLDISILDDMDELEYEGERDYYESDPLDFLEDVELSCSCCIPPFLTFEEWKAERSQGDIIGTNFHRVTFCETSEDAVFSRSQKECVSINLLASKHALKPDTHRNWRLSGNGKGTTMSSG